MRKKEHWRDEESIAVTLFKSLELDESIVLLEVNVVNLKD